MMKINKITKEDILTWVNQEDIFKHYLGFFSWRKLFPNPLRNDRNPGCSFYRSRTGTIYFHDFAQGKQYDCFNLIMEMYGLTFYEAIEKVYEDMISKDTFKVAIIENNTIIKKELPKVIKEKEHIKFEYVKKKWSKKEWEYWKQYGITIGTLREYNVKCLSYIAINNKTLFRSEVDNPLFAYIVNKSIKIYRPYSINKANKWRNNLTDLDIEGYEQLNLSSKKTSHKFNLLIITKSLKDVMVLKEMGYYAIAGHSETSMIDDKIIQNCQKHFKYIVTLFDNDAAGVKGSLQYKEKYGISNIFLTLSKDISDSVVQYGFLESKAHLKKQLENEGFIFSRSTKKNL